MTESLRNISENYLAIRDELFDTMDEETGEVNSEVLERLNSIQESFVEKAQNVALVCLELSDRKEAIQKEIDRLKVLLKRVERGEKALREYLGDNVKSAGYEKIDGVLARISFISSEETIIDNISLLPSEYVTVETTYKPDRKAIKAAIKAGKEVDGAHIEKKKNLQIK